jgi:hypothetical protein
MVQLEHRYHTALADGTELYQDWQGRIHFVVNDKKALKRLKKRAARKGMTLDEFIQDALCAAFPGSTNFTARSR